MCMCGSFLIKLQPTKSYENVMARKVRLWFVKVTVYVGGLQNCTQYSL